MTRPLSWEDSAACRGLATAERDPWSADTPRHVTEAKAVCETCPVRRQCLEDAGDDVWLVRGGLTARERETPLLVAEVATLRASVASVHGHRGTYLHCTAGEDGGKCSDCRRANSEYQAGYRDHGPAVTRTAWVNPFEQMTIGARA